jgi:DNA-binding NarL/FixJ family response regulator
MQPETKITVLIAHSEPVISAGLGAILRRRGDFKVVDRGQEPVLSQETASQALSAEVAIADYDWGLRLVASTYACRDRVVILTDCDSEAKICHALEQGVRGSCRLELPESAV